MYQFHARSFRLRLILIACIATALILGLAAIMAVYALNCRRFNALSRQSHWSSTPLAGAT